MSDLHLHSLEIKNFRCFEHLVIPKLGRVNLIVGKNSVGKTALLEALWLLSCNGNLLVIQKILYDRNELVRYKSSEPRNDVFTHTLETQEQLESIKSFFFGRPPKKHEPIDTVSGYRPIQSTGSIDATFFTIKSNKKAFSLALPYNSQLNSYVNHYIYGYQYNIQTDSPKDEPEQHAYREITFPALPQRDFLDYSIISQSKDLKTVFIPLSGLTWQATSTYWDDLALTDKEEAIISSLEIIDSSIKRITFKGENLPDRIRYSVVKSTRFDSPLPLANMGEGIQRILALALAMSTASNGCLLVDEFETGLHHSVQADVWRAVFKLAKEWNVQIFATTHSWDCVEAFQEASAEDNNEEAMLFRLQRNRKSGCIEAEVYDERMLGIATRQGVEVR